MDDISLTVGTTSLKKNAKILEREAKKLYNLGAYHSIEFDFEKTELMHFTAAKKTRTTTVNLPKGNQAKPKELVRWLGIWFDSKPNFKKHVAIRVSQAKNSFFRISRLAIINAGLSPQAIRQIYLARVNSVSDLCNPIWWRNQISFTSDLQKLQNLETRKILGLFKTTPARVMEIEADLPPPKIRLNDFTRRYSLRIESLSQNYPVWSHLNKECPENTNITKLTQLEIAYAAAKDIWPNDPEVIRFHKTKPWRIKPAYKVNIGKQEKNKKRYYITLPWKTTQVQRHYMCIQMRQGLEETKELT